MHGHHTSRPKATVARSVLAANTSALRRGLPYARPSAPAQSQPGPGACDTRSHGPQARSGLRLTSQSSTAGPSSAGGSGGNSRASGSPDIGRPGMQFGSSGRNGPRVRNFCFTLPNYTEDDYSWFRTCHGNPTFLIVAKETCPTTGTPHLQGAMCLGRAVAFSTVKKWLPFHSAHIEPMRGTPYDSYVYCSKEDPNPIIVGAIPTQTGTSSVLDRAIEEIRGGASLSTLTSTPELAHAFVCHNRGLTALSRELDPERDPDKPPVCFWVYGDTGLGKTEAAFKFGCQYGGRGGCKILPDSTLKWFDGYKPRDHKVVIIDDFRSKGVIFNFLLQVLDRYPIQVPVKGGFVNWAPEVIIITTPKSIEETFEMRNLKRPEDIAQVKRRIGRFTYDYNDDGEQDNFRIEGERLIAALQPPAPITDVRGDDTGLQPIDDGGTQSASDSQQQHQLQYIPGLEWGGRRNDCTDGSGSILDSSSSQSGSQSLVDSSLGSTTKPYKEAAPSRFFEIRDYLSLECKASVDSDDAETSSTDGAYDTQSREST